MAKRYYDDFYNPRNIQYALADKEERAKILKDYSDMRKIANRRLENFKGTEWESSKQYQMNAGKYKKISDIKDDTELAHLLTELHGFVTSATSTVTGLKQQRNRTIETLHERGYTFINKGNLRQFGDFMEDIRQRQLASLYDSARLADVFHMAEKKGITPGALAERFSDYEKQQAHLPPEQRNSLKRASSKELWEGLNADDLYNSGLPSRSRKKRPNS